MSGEPAVERVQLGKNWSRFLTSSKKRIGKVASRNFWCRYALLAPYLALRACIASFTGSTKAGSTHATNSIDDALEYVFHVFDEYKLFAGVDGFPGKVAEIGAGDSSGVALLFLAHGCDHIDVIDRFFSPRDNAQQQKINQSIAAKYPGLSSRLLDGSFSESSFRGLLRHYGEAAAAEVFFRQNQGYSAIVSRAVFEHLYDPLSALLFSSRALAPGGIMVHCVDCRDHGLFSEQFHELKFLELPEVLYAPLKWRGGPNRIRLSSYVDVLKRESLEYSIYIRRLAGVKEEIPPKTTFEQIDQSLLQASRTYVASIRRSLASPFSQMDEQDLMVQGFSIYTRRR